MDGDSALWHIMLRLYAWRASVAIRLLSIRSDWYLHISPISNQTQNRRGDSHVIFLDNLNEMYDIIAACNLEPPMDFGVDANAGDNRCQKVVWKEGCLAINHDVQRRDLTRKRKNEMHGSMHWIVRKLDCRDNACLSVYRRKNPP